MPPLAAQDIAGQDSAGQDSAPEEVRYQIQPLEVEDEDLAEALGGSSLLLARRKQPLEDTGALLNLARRDEDRLAKVLRARGYFDASLAIHIAGQEITAPDIRDALLDAPMPVDVRIAIDPGLVYRIGDITLDWSDVPPQGLEVSDESLGIAVGDPARGADIFAARDRLVAALRDKGYPLATGLDPDAVIDRDSKIMDVRFPVVAGSKASIGPITYTGNETVEAELLARAQPVELGEPYTPQALASLRSELSALGVFSAVRVREGDALDAQNRLPITVELTERKRRFVGFGAHFASDKGIGLNAEWGHRNLFGQAEQLTATASVDRIGGDVGSGIDYSLGLGFSKPAFYRRDQRLFANTSLLKEAPDAFERRAATSEIGIERRINPILSASLAGSLELSEITEDSETNNYFLIGLPATLKLDTTDDLLDPTSGWRGSVEASPFVDLGMESEPFFRFGGGLARYLDILGNGRSILAGRVGFGMTLGEETRSLPADKRFFSGGGGSVRGFDFQSLGPRNSSGDPRGGRSLLEASLEYRQKISGNWGAVAFIDSGSAYSSILPVGAGDLRYAVGGGIRYFTPIGPIRFDLAFPLNRKRDEDSFQFYIGLGQAF